MTINLSKLRTPHFIFIIYVLVSSLLIMLFRFIIPGEEAPLMIYSRTWRLTQGLLELINLFPALAFSALVIPFGLAAFEENYQSFSEMFFKRLAPSVITVIAASVIYGLVFFIVYPAVKNNEENMRFTGSLYHHAKKNAQDSADQGEWFEASQFLAICERIWRSSPELNALKDTVTVNLERNISASAGDSIINIIPLSEDQRPVDATQAIEMSLKAFEEERYFDAHWLANLGELLAVRGSAQAANAAQLSSEAWNMIVSFTPSRAETHLSWLYNLKLSGYQAMGSGDFIHAYYIFLELMTYTPDDPDVKKFFDVSREGAIRTAFFIDEIELSLGDILNGAVFSFPSGNGRAVLRLSSLTLSDDVAYGIGLDYMDFDANMNLRSNGSARYVKLLPFFSNGKPQMIILTHSLDRLNKDISFQSEWLLGSEPPGGIILDISYEEFLLISKVRRGLPNLQINELFAAVNSLEKAGYISQIFHAEILNRLGSALFFMPMAIFIIVIAWRFRARQKTRYVFFLMLPVLPVVFHGFVFLYRSIINTLGIWLVLSAGFGLTLVIYIAFLAVSLFVSLIVLAAQHS